MWLKRYQETGDAGDSMPMRIIHMSLQKPEDFQALKSMMGSNGLGLIEKIEVIKHTLPSGSGTSSDRRGLHYFVRYYPSAGDGLGDGLSYGELSLGTRRVIRAIASLLFDSSSVMLIEQLEDGLHPGLARKVVGLMRQNALGAQLILASHSSALLNSLNPEEIRLVSLLDGSTNVQKLSARELKAAGKFMDEEGPLYDFLEMVQEK
jgi:hypothetical protein